MIVNIIIDADIGSMSLGEMSFGSPTSVRVSGRCGTREDVHALVERLCESLEIPKATPPSAMHTKGVHPLD